MRRLAAFALAACLGLGPVHAQPADGFPAPLQPQLRTPRGADVLAVGDLGMVEGPIAGTLTDENGGLGRGMWGSTERGVVDAILVQAPVTSPSATGRLLLRKLLLTAAPPPTGRGQGAFNALRIRKLLDGGFIEEAADLARSVRSTDIATQQIQAEAFLYAGRDTDACGEVTGQRMQSGERFWIELRAYCYALAADEPALELTRAVMEQQGIVEVGFLSLVDALLGRALPDIPPITEPDAIGLRLLARLQKPIPANVVNALGMPASAVAVASTFSAREVRLAAAERLLRAGALPQQNLAEALSLIVFRPQDLTGAAAMARNEPLLNALARLRAALRAATVPAQRAELIYTAFQIGEREGLLPHVAALFANDAAALMPARDWSNWSSLMTRALLLAGRNQAAGRWFDILPPTSPDRAAPYLRVIFAFAAPDDPRSAGLPLALSDLAMHAMAQNASPVVMMRGAMALGLFEATGRDMPPDARARVAPLLQLPHLGMRPSQLALQRIDAAALAGRRGEVVLGAIDALGAKGAKDLPPDIIVRLVRALRTAGVNDAARALTNEALLTHPTGA